MGLFLLSMEAVSMTTKLKMGLAQLDAEIATESLKSVLDWILDKLTRLLELALQFKDSIVRAIVSRNSDLRTLKERIKSTRGKSVSQTTIALPTEPNFFRNSAHYVDSWNDLIAGVNRQTQVLKGFGGLIDAMNKATPALIQAIENGDGSFRMIDQVRLEYNQLVARNSGHSLLDGSKINYVENSLDMRIVYGSTINGTGSLPTPHPISMSDLVDRLEHLHDTVRNENGVEGVRRSTHRLKAVVQDAQRKVREVNQDIYHELSTILYPINLYLELLHRSALLIDEHSRILWVATEEYLK